MLCHLHIEVVLFLFYLVLLILCYFPVSVLMHVPFVSFEEKDVGFLVYLQLGIYIYIYVCVH